VNIMPGAFITGDMTALLAQSDFGVIATYGGSQVPGIFDNGHVEVQNGEGVTMIVRECSFTGRSADFPSIAEGDTLVISGLTYTVRTWVDDGAGEIEIIVEPA